MLETGVPNLDRVLGGGLRRGSLTMVIGAPGNGKTILAQQIAFLTVDPQLNLWMIICNCC